jgi:hypothetical protein
MKVIVSASLETGGSPRKEMMGRGRERKKRKEGRKKLTEAIPKRK